MAEKISVVIIDADEHSRRFIKELLKKIQRVKVAAEATNLARAYEVVKKNKPTIVILDLFPEEDGALKLAEKITQNFPKITLFVTSSEIKPELIIKAMRAGAREFLPKPLNKDELLTAVKNLIRWESRRFTEEDSHGKMITVFGMKGGVGTTTIATNLAVNLASHTSKSVILVDLNLQLGTAALFLNIQSKYSIVDVINNIEDIDPKLLTDVLPKHASGVCLLARPSRLEEAESLIGSHFDQITALLGSIFDYIIIDANEGLNDFSVRALDESDSILTVSTAELPSIYNTRRCLDIFKRMGYGKDKLLLVINRYDSNKGVTSEEIEKSLKYPVFWTIPNQDYATVIKSINEGIPISTMTPRSKVSQNFKKLAEHFNGSVFMEQENTKRKRKSSLIKKIFWRKNGALEKNEVLEKNGALEKEGSKVR